MGFPPWVSDLANILEVLGFLLTLWVLWQTWSIRREFALRGRVPELKRSLMNTARQLPPLLREWPSQRNETLMILASARPVLENLSEKLPRKEKAAVKALVSDLKDCKTGIFQRIPIARYSSEQMWKLFTDLQGVIGNLEQREKDASWK